MKKLIIAILTLFTAVLETSAKIVSEDILYFKNGNIIRGNVLKIVPDSIVQLRSKEGDTLVFEIQSIAEIIIKDASNNSKPDFKIKPSKFTHSFDAGFLVARNQYYYYFSQFSYYFSTSYTFNYNILPFVSVGAGTGVDEYNAKPLVPLFGELKFIKNKGRMMPYISVYFGHSYYWLGGDVSNTGVYETKREGGRLFGSGLGVKYFISPETAFTFSVGFRNQKAKTTENTIKIYNDFPSVKDYTYSRITYKLGVCF